MHRIALLALVSTALLTSGCFRLDMESDEWQPPNRPAEAREIAPREPCEREPARRALFGELHLHTGASFDHHGR